ncbi:MAG: elongation factor G [Lachnospiraceae bacterium]|nr:elongation factor G [Lachnospiraceae bacterium]
MNVYTTDKIRNVVLLGHGGCGKTSLAEAMAYLAGLTSRVGKVADGNTISDFGKEEQKRQISISTSVIPMEWEGAKINVLDTPGFFDFVGEVEEAMNVADLAIIVISGKAGIEVGAERAWDLCEKHKMPRMIYVSDMDIDDVSYRQVVQDLEDKYGKKIAPFNLPIRENEKFVGYVNVIQEKGFRWEGKEVKECPVPDYNEENLKLYRDALMEAVAETSEEFMDRYFGGDTFSEAEIRSAVRIGVNDCSIVPVTMGSSTLVQGVFTLMDDIVKYCPSPDMRKIAGINSKTNEIFEADYDFSKPKSAFVWKTMMDSFIGKYSLIKVRSGVIKTDDMLYDVEEGSELKIGKLFILTGNKASEIPELHAGDIGALQKLDVNTSDTLSTKATPVQYAKMDLPKPFTIMRYRAVNKGDIDKVSQSLQKMAAEDPTLRVVNDGENRQTLIYGMGDQHIEVVASRLQNEFKVPVELMKPKVAFRETIRKNSDVDSKYKKQTGGHGQYGHVKMKFSPSGEMETPYVFEQEVVGGSVPKNYFPAVEKGLVESCQSGPLAAYPVVGVRAVLYDGSYHPVDSSEGAFKVATRDAFKKGFMEAGPVLLEPIVTLKVTVPDAYTGDVMGDLNKRRGRVLGMNPVGGKQVIEAEVPQMELYGYCTQLRSMTGGAGDFEYEFARYEQTPSDVQEKEVAARAAKVAEGDVEE